MKWTDVHSGEDFNVTTTLAPQRGLVRIKSIRDVFDEYEFHPEPKSAGVNGEAADRRTCGLLAGRAVEAVSITYVGKESNLLEDVENEIVHLGRNSAAIPGHATGSAERRAQEDPFEGTREGRAHKRAGPPGDTERTLATVSDNAKSAFAGSEAILLLTSAGKRRRSSRAQGRATLGCLSSERMVLFRQIGTNA